MPIVWARQGEPIEALIRRFKRRVDQEEVLRQFRARSEYTKPSVERRQKRRWAQTATAKRAAWSKQRSAGERN